MANNLVSAAIGKIFSEFNKEVDKAKQSAKELNAIQIKGANDATVAVNNTTKAINTETAALERQKTVLNEGNGLIGKRRAQLDSLREALTYAKSVEEIKKLNKEISASEKELSKLENAGKRSVGFFKDFAQQANGTFGLLASGGFAFAGAAAIQSVIRTGSEFEKTLSKVKALTLATGSEFDALKQQAKDLGATTQFSASQAAEAMANFASAGLNAQQISAALPGTLNLAAAGVLDLGEATEITTAVMNGFGFKVGDIARINDVLVKSNAVGTTTVRGMGQAFQDAGPAAAAAGLDFEQTAAALVQIQNAGIPASVAGTAFRSAITQLQDPTSQANKELRQLGVNVFDSSGKLKSLVDIVKTLESKKVSQALFQQILGAEGGRLSLVLAQGSAALEKITTQLELAGPEAAQASFGFRDAGGAIEALTKKFGDQQKSADIVKDAFNSLKDPASNLSKTLKTSFNIDTKTAKGQIKDFSVILNELASSGNTKGLDKLKKDFPDISKALDVGATSIAEYDQRLRIAGGTAAQIAAIQSDNLAGSIDNLSSAFEGVQIEIFEVGAKAIRPLIDLIAGLFTAGIKVIDFLKVFSQQGFIFRTTLGAIAGVLYLLNAQLINNSILSLKTIASTIASTAVRRVSYILTLLETAEENKKNRALIATTATQIANTAATKSATVATQGATIAARIFNLTVAGNPLALFITLLTGAVSILTSYLYLNALFGKQQTEVNSILILANEEYAKQKTQVDLLFESFANLNASSVERNNILAEINSKYKDYLPFLLNERSSLDEIAFAQGEVNRQLLNNIIIKQKQSKIEESVKKELDARIALNKALRESGLSQEAQAKILKRNEVGTQLTAAERDVEATKARISNLDELIIKEKTAAKLGSDSTEQLFKELDSLEQRKKNEEEQLKIKEKLVKALSTEQALEFKNAENQDFRTSALDATVFRFTDESKIRRATKDLSEARNEQTRITRDYDNALDGVNRELTDNSIKLDDNKDKTQGATLATGKHVEIKKFQTKEFKANTEAIKQNSDSLRDSSKEITEFLNQAAVQGEFTKVFSAFEKESGDIQKKAQELVVKSREDLSKNRQEAIDDLNKQKKEAQEAIAGAKGDERRELVQKYSLILNEKEFNKQLEKIEANFKTEADKINQADAEQSSFLAKEIALRRAKVLAEFVKSQTELLKQAKQTLEQTNLNINLANLRFSGQNLEADLLDLENKTKLGVAKIQEELANLQAGRKTDVAKFDAEQNALLNGVFGGDPDAKIAEAKKKLQDAYAELDKAKAANGGALPKDSILDENVTTAANELATLETQQNNLVNSQLADQLATENFITNEKLKQLELISLQTEAERAKIELLRKAAEEEVKAGVDALKRDQDIGNNRDKRVFEPFKEFSNLFKKFESTDSAKVYKKQQDGIKGLIKAEDERNVKFRTDLNKNTSALQEAEAQDDGSERSKKRIDNLKQERAQIESFVVNSDAKLQNYQKDLDENEAQEDADKTDRKKEQAKAIINFTQEVSGQVFGALNDANQREQERLDTFIQNQQTKVDGARQRANDNKSKYDAEQLQLEEERLDALNKQKEDAVNKQRTLALVELITNTILAVSRAAVEGGPLAPFTIALALSSLATGIIAAREVASSALSGFKEGGYTGDRGSSDVAGVVHGREFVFPAHQTAENKDFFEKIHQGKVSLKETFAKADQYDNLGDVFFKTGIIKKFGDLGILGLLSNQLERNTLAGSSLSSLLNLRGINNFGGQTIGSLLGSNASNGVKGLLNNTTFNEVFSSVMLDRMNSDSNFAKTVLSNTSLSDIVRNSNNSKSESFLNSLSNTTISQLIDPNKLNSLLDSNGITDQSKMDFIKSKIEKTSLKDFIQRIYSNNSSSGVLNKEKLVSLLESSTLDTILHTEASKAMIGSTLIDRAFKEHTIKDILSMAYMSNIFTNDRNFESIASTLVLADLLNSSGSGSGSGDKLNDYLGSNSSSILSVIPESKRQAVRAALQRVEINDLLKSQSGKDLSNDTLMKSLSKVALSSLLADNILMQKLATLPLNPSIINSIRSDSRLKELINSSSIMNSLVDKQLHLKTQLKDLPPTPVVLGNNNQDIKNLVKEFKELSEVLKKSTPEVNVVLNEKGVTSLVNKGNKEIDRLKNRLR